MMLLNGNTQERTRSSEGFTLLDCGCAHTDTHWHQLCDLHGMEWRAVHEAALLEHAARIATAWIEE